MNFLYISDDETNFTVGIVSRNLATTSKFVEFRDKQNFTLFEAPRVIRALSTCRVADTVPRVKCRLRQTKSSSGTYKRHVATHDWREIQGKWIR